MPAEMQALAGQLTRFEALANPQDAARSAPEISGWRVGQHLAHISMATAYCLRNVVELMEDGGRFAVPGGALHEQARAILESGVIPGGATSPKEVEAPEEPDLAHTINCLAAARASMTQLSGLPIASTALRIPHPLLGPLDAPEWLRFARIHADHHLAILDRL